MIPKDGATHRLSGRCWCGPEKWKLEGVTCYSHRRADGLDLIEMVEHGLEIV